MEGPLFCFQCLENRIEFYTKYSFTDRKLAQLFAMAEAFNLDGRVEQEALAKITHRVFPQHLERFATTLLRFTPAKYYHKTHNEKPWTQAYKVSLKFWISVEVQQNE